MSCVIRHATVEDVPAICDLWRLMFQRNVKRDDRLMVYDLGDDRLDYWLRIHVGHPEEALLAVAKDFYGMTVGFVHASFLNGKIAEGHELCVLNEGGGLGSKLFEFMLGWARERKASYFHFETSVYNGPMHRIAKKFGFRELTSRYHLEF